MLFYLASKLNFTKMRPLLRKERVSAISRLLSYSDDEKPSKFIYEPNFTSDEQKYILERINDANIDELRRYSLPKNRLKKIDDWRKKHGKFNSIIEILDVEGLGVKTLDKLCKNILQGESESDTSDLKDRPNKSRGQFLIPLISTYQSQELSSTVGVHLYATGISWAKIERSNNFLSDWNSHEFDLGSKKLSIADALQLVINVSSEIPTCDAYVFEAPISVTPTAQQSPVSVGAYVQRVQLMSMLITVLSTSHKHNPTYMDMLEKDISDKNIIHINPKVFFLRHKLSARLFRTLVGTERVSAATTVSNILNSNIPDNLVHTPITVNEDLTYMYSKQLPLTKEVLGQALLLTIAFMDICVYKNPTSLKVVSTHSR